MRESLRIERKAKLLEAAALVFSQNGYAKTTIAQVATCAGMGKGTVYGYFKSKEELFLALFDWYGKQAMPDVDLSSAPSIQDGLLHFTQKLLEALTEKIEMFPLTLEFWAASASEGLRDEIKTAMKGLYDGYRATLAAMLQQGVDSGEFKAETPVDALASGMVCTIDALGLQYWMNTDFDILDTGHQTIKAMLDGIKL